MKKCILLMLFSFILISSACSHSEEDTRGFSGVIGEGKNFGYAYIEIKEQNKNSWKVSYKGDISIIEERAANKDDLVNYRNAVNDSELVLAKLLTSVAYFLIVSITSLILYKKNRKMLKKAGVIITILAGIAVHIAFNASVELSRLLQDAKYCYLILTI